MYTTFDSDQLILILILVDLNYHGEIVRLFRARCRLWNWNDQGYPGIRNDGVSSIYHELHKGRGKKNTNSDAKIQHKICFQPKHWRRIKFSDECAIEMSLISLSAQMFIQIVERRAKKLCSRHMAHSVKYLQHTTCSRSHILASFHMEK